MKLDTELRLDLGHNVLDAEQILRTNTREQGKEGGTVR